MTIARRQILAVALAILALAVPGHAEVKRVFSSGGVAISGYDAVAYFTEGRPVPGDDQFMLKWRGAIWMFSSAAHLEAFEMDPRAYAPQYGGYCAYSVAHGQAASSDPLAFAVRDGRLYLSHSQEVLRIWRKDQAGFISQADKAWPELVKR